MKNPFGDEPVAGTAPKSSAVSTNPFGDTPADGPGQGYLGASAKAGMYDLAGVVASTVDALNPFTTSEADLAVLFKDDPEGFKHFTEKSLNGTYQRVAKNASAKAAQVMSNDNLSSEAQGQRDKVYATTDVGEAAWADPTKVAGDVLRSAPSSIAMAGSVVLTRGAGQQAYAQARAMGATEAVARAAAMRASAETMAVAGAGSEGTIGAAQGFNQQVEEGEKMTEEQLRQSPYYQRLLKDGYDPQTAKARAVQQAAREAGTMAGAVDASVNAVGGAVLGRVLGSGAGRLASGAAAGLEGSVTEAIQSPGETVTGNVATRRYLNPFQDVAEGALEATASGGVVGFASSAPIGVIGKQTHETEERSKALSAAAEDIELKDKTGFTKQEAQATAEKTGTAAAKPRLNARQVRVGQEAQAQGVDPKLAIAVMGLESAGKADAKNPNSSASGLFQIIDSTWEALGGGDRNDEATQMRNGIRYLAQVTKQLSGSLGHAPSQSEVYMGHLFGPAGARNIITAYTQDPQGSILDTVRRYDARNAEAIVKNNGLSGLTNEQAYLRVDARVSKQMRESGLDPDFNQKHAAQAGADDVPSTKQSQIDALAEELNAKLAEDETSPLTEEEERLAQIEEGNINSELEDTTEEHRELDQANPVEENAPPVAPIPRLPRELAGANPYYGNFNLEFNDDVEKAAYIIGNAKDASRADPRYLAFVTEHTGMDEAEARAYGREIIAQVKALASQVKDQNERVLRVQTSKASLPDSYVSRDEQRTRGRYENPNDRIAVSKTPIAAASDPSALGQTLGTRKLQAGEVVALNVEGQHTPAAYVEAAQQTVQDWVARFMPKSNVVLTFRSLSPGAVAEWHAFKRLGRNMTSKKRGERYLHQLNLRNATNLGNTDDGSTNPSTQRKIAYSMAHEFGHALAEEEFKRGMSDDLSAKFDNLGTEEFFTEQDLLEMPEDTAAVLREYNELKKRVLTDQTMTARQFIEAWLSPWKTAHGRDSKTGTRQGAESFAHMYLGQSTAMQLDKAGSARTIARAMNETTGILTPHEYMAEQFARYAYSRKLLENSPLAKAFFDRVLTALREFFTNMKRSGVAEPGVQFAAWVDSLTNTTKETGQNAALPKEEIAAPVKKAKPRITAKQVAAAQAKSASIAPVAATGTRANDDFSLKVNVAGVDARMIQDTAGEWFEVGPAGIPTGGPLGQSMQGAKSQLAQRIRQRQAVERNATQAKYVQAIKPSILPPAIDKTSRHGIIAPETKSEDQIAAEQLFRTDPTIRELKSMDPDIYQELRDMLQAGKVDEFKDTIVRYLPDEVAEKIRFDMDNPEHQNLAEISSILSEKLPGRTGLKSFFGHGLRKLSDAKYFTMTLTQMAYANPFSAGLHHLNKSKNDFKTFKSRLEFRAVENAQRWAKLGKEQRGLLEKAMRQEHYDGRHMFDLTRINGYWRVTANENVMTYANRVGLDEDTVQLWQDIKNSHLQHMGTLQSTLVKKAQERLRNKPALLKKKIYEITQMFNQIRSAPFLPQTRFGEYAIQIRESGLDGNELVHVEFFESAASRDEAVVQLRKHLKPGQKLMPSNYSPTSAILRTLPPQILSTYAEEFELTAMQRKELRELADMVTRNQQTRKYSTQLAQISGANKDLLRNYADFMSHNSNNIAKLFYRDEFNKAIRMLEHETNEAKEEGNFEAHDEARKLTKFGKSYADHMLNPAQEYHMLRSFVVLKMLWGNIKTALANVNSLAQLWALASRQQGLVSGTKNVGGLAMKTLAQSISNIGNKVIRGGAEGGQVFSNDERYALDLAKQNGMLDETFAAQLASFANNGVLNRLNATGVDKTFRQIVWIGMQPQHMVENYTRRVTLLTQFNNYMKNEGMTRDEAFNAAAQDLYLLQGDNTQVNRPAFMRGRASLFLIFYGYMQNMMYLMSGAQERARNARASIDANPEATIDDIKKDRHISLNGETVKMWMAYAFLGGLMGLPGAEDLDKILGLVADKMFGKHFSLKEHAFKVASTISEEASAFGLDINPRSIVHGNMSDLNMFGMLPSVDVSPSMSLGQAVPGAGGIDKLGQRGGAGEFLLGLMGPAGSMIKDLQKAMSDDPSMLNKMGLVMPNTVTGWAKAVKEHQHGVMYPSGGKVTFDAKTGEVRDLTTGETLSRLMGFMPSIISSNKELHWMQKEKADYWTNRRNTLTAQMWEARKMGDREAEADARQAIRDFNQQADPGLRLTAKDVNSSMKKRKANAQRDTRREAAAKRYRGMYREMEEEFRGDAED